MTDAIGLHEAYKRGDLAAVRAALGDPPDFPNCRGPRGMGENILEYAIYWSPLPFVRTLLELGADPNYGDHAGFPSLIAALSTSRPDRAELVALLLSHGADTGQRGVNDYTPLHCAAATDDAAMIELLLAHGADPSARTNVDDYATPLEEAERLGRALAVRALRARMAG
jgi:ankyrin repeat protein